MPIRVPMAFGVGLQLVRIRLLPVPDVFSVTLPAVLIT